MEKIYLKIIEGLRDYFEKNGFSRAVIGLSGGVDSSLTLKLAVDALKAKNVTALLMPELGVTDRTNIDHANKLADFFNVEHFKVPINGYVKKFEDLPWARVSEEYAAGLELGNINTKARIRSVILYHFANTFQCLVLGTSNLSEILLGYGTKFGDLAADIEVIGDLYKTEVRKLAEFLNLPPEIINKKPSAELYAGQSDEGELGADYEILDKILAHRGQKIGEVADVVGAEPELVKKVFERIEANRHKSEMPHVVKLKIKN